LHRENARCKRYSWCLMLYKLYKELKSDCLKPQFVRLGGTSITYIVLSSLFNLILNSFSRVHEHLKKLFTFYTTRFIYLIHCFCISAELSSTSYNEHCLSSLLHLNHVQNCILQKINTLSPFFPDNLATNIFMF
jgi:hypothetical protein